MAGLKRAVLDFITGCRLDVGVGHGNDVRCCDVEILRPVLAIIEPETNPDRLRRIGYIADLDIRDIGQIRRRRTCQVRHAEHLAVVRHTFRRPVRDKVLDGFRDDYDSPLAERKPLRDVDNREKHVRRIRRKVFIKIKE